MQSPPLRTAKDLFLHMVDEMAHIVLNMGPFVKEIMETKATLVSGVGKEEVRLRPVMP